MCSESKETEVEMPDVLASGASVLAFLLVFSILAFASHVWPENNRVTAAVPRKQPCKESSSLLFLKLKVELACIRHLPASGLNANLAKRIC